MSELSHRSYEEVLRGLSEAWLEGWYKVSGDKPVPSHASAGVWVERMADSRRSKSLIEANAASTIKFLGLDGADVHELALDYISRYGGGNVALHSATRMATRRARTAVWARLSDLESERRNLDKGARRV